MCPQAVSGLRVGTGYTGRSDDGALLGQNFLRHFDVEMWKCGNGGGTVWSCEI